MDISVFNPMAVEVGPIGPMMAAKVESAELKEFFLAKSAEGSDGNLSGIVIGDSETMGVGVGTWSPDQYTHEPITLHFDEVLFIVEGSFKATANGVTHSARKGECIYLRAGTSVDFSTEDGCRLVWVTSPPTWKAMEMAWESARAS